MLDLDGLQVAYLGVALAHYLDLETGDIIDQPLDDPPPGEESRFLRVPARTEETEAEDRRLFLPLVKIHAVREQLAAAVDDPHTFRQILHEDRLVERSFFNFKNDRATKAIEEWLEAEGLS
ncbi:MAG TPA: hypothetical protein VE974_28320 [Thermoanaerobaculia bacterium]|nr:hypothetical protein [Thermoanaerobaculia bacterium]